MKKRQLHSGICHVSRLVKPASSRIFWLLALLVLGAGMRASAQSVAVTTLPASGQSNNVATLNGRISPNGSAAYGWFNWGTAAFNYTQQTPPVGVGSGNNTAVSISDTLTSLTPGVVYHGQMVGSNATGVIVQGADVMFGSPALTLLGGASVTNLLGSTFTDPGVAISNSPVAITIGQYWGLVLKSDGTLVTWGNNSSKLLNPPSGVFTGIASGYAHDLALQANGTVVGWGDDTAGANVPAGLTNVVAIAGGDNDSLALINNGTVVAWGYNQYGETNVPAGLGNVVAIGAGAYHSLAVVSGGTVVAWGDNASGQTNVPAGLTNAVAVAGGMSHSIALLNNGTVVGWGDNTYGQTNSLPSLTNVVAISAGQYHNLALRSDGTVIAWGLGTSGQTNVPAGLSNVVAIAAGGNQSIALLSNGSTVMWGDKTHGFQNIPPSLSTLSTVYTVTGTVNTGAPGIYTLTYTATNTLGGVGTVTRTVVVPSSYPSTFLVSAPTNATAGTPFNFTVTAVDQFGTIITGYTGTVHFATTDGGSPILPLDSTLNAGVGTFSATLTTVGVQTLTAIDTVSNSVTGSTNVTVTAGAATQFVFGGVPASTTAGVPFIFSVTAEDQYGNVDTGYSGTVHFTSSDSQASLPGDSTLNLGEAFFMASFGTAGTNSLTATDTSVSSLTSSANVSVIAGAATQLVVNAPADASVGVPFNFTVTAEDEFGNVATSFGDTIYFMASDSANIPSAGASLVNGMGTFSATPLTAGPLTLSAIDQSYASIAGSANVSVSTGQVALFLVSAPTNTTAGVPFNFTVSAVDVNSNVVPGYTGLVSFASSDALALLPGISTLTNGVGTFPATLATAGLVSLSATDTVSNNITGSTNVTVVAGPMTQFVVSAPTNATAGIAFDFTVTAVDQYTNTVTDYAGTVHFTTSDAGSGTSLPIDSTLTNGAGTFSATLVTAGGQSLTATDTVTNSLTGSASVTVAAGAAFNFLMNAPATATAGSSFNFSVTAVDQYGNVAKGYSGTVAFGSGDAQAVLPPNSTLFNGTGTFSATLKTAGSQSLTASDTVVSSLTVGATVNVSAASAVNFIVSAPATATAGTAITFTVTADDQYGNVATGYAGTVHFTTTDPSASLPADAPLNAGVGSFNATLKTAGNQTLSGTDIVNSSITGTSANISVAAGAATQLAVVAPSTMKARIPSDFSVTAQDAYGNTAVTYAGTVHFTSTDGSAILPADSTLTNGLGTFSVTMKTAGTQTLTGTDTVNANITGTSASIEVLDLQIVVQPVNQEVLLSSNASFSVGVSGTAPFAYQWFANGAVVGGATSDTLTVSNVTLTTATNYQVVITNAWGSVTSSVAQLIPAGWFKYQTNQAHTAVLNPVSGLYEESIVVTNAGGPISGVQILVGGLPAHVSLENAAGTNNGRPYAQWNIVMQTGATNTFLLQFLNTSRLVFTNTIDVVALAAGTNAASGSKVSTQGIPISQVYTDNSIAGSPRFTLAFASTPGQSYQVFYSDDSLSTWQLASTITATSTWTIWTELLPPASGSRFFKVIPFSNIQ